MSFVFTCMCVLLRDAASRRELISVIGLLADSQPDILVTSLLHCLLNSGVISKNGEPRYPSELKFTAASPTNPHLCVSSSEAGGASLVKIILYIYYIYDYIMITQQMLTPKIAETIVECLLLRNQYSVYYYPPHFTLLLFYRCLILLAAKAAALLLSWACRGPAF